MRCSPWRRRQRVWGCGASAGPCVVEWGCARPGGLGGPWGAGGVARRSARSPPEAAAGSGAAGAGRGRDGRGLFDVTPPRPAPPRPSRPRPAAVPEIAPSAVGGRLHPRARLPWQPRDAEGRGRSRGPEAAAAHGGPPPAARCGAVLCGVLPQPEPRRCVEPCCHGVGLPTRVLPWGGGSPGVLLAVVLARRSTPAPQAVGWQLGAKWGQVAVWGVSDLGCEGASLERAPLCPQAAGLHGSRYGNQLVKEPLSLPWKLDPMSSLFTVP